MKDLLLAGIQPGCTQRTEITVKDVTFGGKEVVLIGGPCAVESYEQVKKAAQVVKRAGGKVLRGGIFKPRSSPYSFQGLGEEGLEYLVRAAKENDLLTVTEALDDESLELIKDKVDIIQIGARNMQNFQLLKRAGKLGNPIILKRGLAATIEEWLLAAEYILAEGNSQVILCERGIRTFETSTRNTLDLSAVGVVKALSHLPIIVDPSHAAGKRHLVPALAKAAIVAGADGLLVEMHPDPDNAQSDGAQSLTSEQFEELGRELREVTKISGRTFSLPGRLTNLQSMREKIDEIDQDIIEFLAERMKVVKQIADEKSLDKIRDVNREREVIQKLVSVAENLECPPELIREIYLRIFDYGVEFQFETKRMKEAKLSVGSY